MGLFFFTVLPFDDKYLLVAQGHASFRLSFTVFIFILNIFYSLLIPFFSLQLHPLFYVQIKVPSFFFLDPNSYNIGIRWDFVQISFHYIFFFQIDHTDILDWPDPFINC